MISIIKELEFQVQEHPDKLLYAFLDIKGNIKESYTYKEFFDRIRSIASHLFAIGVLKPGDKVLLVYPPGLEMICAFFACVKLGVIPVPVYPPSAKGFHASADMMSFIAKNCNAVAILSDRTYYWSIKASLIRRNEASLLMKSDIFSKLEWFVTDDFATSDGEEFPLSHSDILFLQYTSGSTGTPKGVIVTHENIISNCQSIVDHEPIGVSWLPQYHDMGLVGFYLYLAVKTGTTYGFAPLDFIQRPALWLETISKYGATASSAPNFAYEYCLKPRRIPEKTLESLDLSSLKFLMTAAEPVNTKIYKEFLHRFEPYGLNGESFFSGYGLAEFTLAVSSRGRKIQSFDSESLKKYEVLPVDSNQTGVNSTDLMSCGRLLGDTELKIVAIGSDEKEVGYGEIGEIWLNGSSKCKGYWNRPELSKEIFEAALDGDSSTWLRTGDLGFIYQREIYICGRTKDMIIVRGLNYYPQDIEALVEEDSSIRNGCVAAFALDQQGRESLAVVVGLKNKKKIPDAHSINNRLINHLGIGADLFVFIPARTIAKTSSGKIMRYQNKNHLLNNELEVIHRVDIDQTGNLGRGIGLADSADDRQHSMKISTDKDRLSYLFRSFGLTGTESEALGNVGLDSLNLAEFANDLKTHIEVQGLEDLSQKVDLRLLQKIAVSELFKIVHDLQTGSLHSRFRFRRAFALLQSEFEIIEMEAMQKDVHRSIQADNSGQLSKYESLNGHILVTGGTGFFGPFLIKSLLEQNRENIYVIVRADNRRKGMDRLRRAFALTGPTPDIQDRFEQRVIPVCGDISLRNLGIDDEKWDFLASQIHTIYHNGAQVNYLLDYESMRDANVNGTSEIVRFALESRKKMVNHISTTFIFGWSVKDTIFEIDNNEEMDNLDFGYSQSKWVAEQIVKRAMNEGLDARIYRPALISPSIAGEGFNFDISVRLLVFMVNNSIGTSAKNQVSFTPADIAANNIVAISNLEASAGKIFHVTRDTYTTMLDVTNVFSDLTRRHFKIFPLEEFVPEVVRRCHKKDLLFPLLNFLVRSAGKISSMEFKRYDNTNYGKYRDLSAWGKKDKPLEDVVLGIYRFMDSRGVINR